MTGPRQFGFTMIIASAMLGGAAMAEGRILMAPADEAVKQGEMAVFSVVAEGEQLAYQWYRNGVAIVGATGPSYSVTYALPSTAGIYKVAVQSPGETAVFSEDARLSVEPNAMHAMLVPAPSVTSSEALAIR